MPPLVALEKLYVCRGCKAERRVWSALCHACGNRATLEQVERPRRISSLAPDGSLGVPGLDDAEGDEDDGELGDEEDDGELDVIALGSVKPKKVVRLKTGIEGLDRVLGDEDEGGPAEAMAIQFGGARGSGKSTMLLAAAANFALQDVGVLYGSGEGENDQRTRDRAARIGLDRRALMGVHFCDVSRLDPKADRIGLFLEKLDQLGAKVGIVDSLQGFSEDDANPRHVARIARRCMKYAVETRRLIFMVGHLNGEGKLAGGQSTQHLGDGCFVIQRIGPKAARTVQLYCDGKNRGGWVEGEAFFKLTKRGLLEYDPDDGELEAMLAAERPEDGAPTPARQPNPEGASKWRPVNRRSDRAAATSTTPRTARTRTASPSRARTPQASPRRRAG